MTLKDRILRLVFWYALAWNIGVLANVVAWIFAVGVFGSWTLREPNAVILGFEFISTLVTLAADFYLFIRAVVEAARKE